jgi:hypothetical protein
MPIFIHIINMKIRENVNGEGGEEDWWRSVPGYISHLCDNDDHCWQSNGANSEDIRESVLYAKLFENIHRESGSLEGFFGPNTDYAEFKKICQQNPAAKRACVYQYRLLKTIEKN